MKQNLLKTLLVAVGMAAGVNGVWAYDVPDGMEVKQVLVGKLNSTGAVDVETFDLENAEVPGFSNPSNFSIVDLPSDLSVWSKLDLSITGKALRLGSKTTHSLYFDTPVVNGKVVFSSDFYCGTHPKVIKFIGLNDEVVARFAYSDKNENSGRVSQQYLFADSDPNAQYTGSYSLNDTYLGTRNRQYEINEVVIDLDANTLTYSGRVMDRRSQTNKWCDDEATITYSVPISGIKGIEIDATGCRSSDYYAYFDNMSLYAIGVVAGSYNYTVNAVCGSEELGVVGTGVAEAGAMYSVSSLPEVIEQGGQYYQLSDAEVKKYTKFFTMGEADATETVSYRSAADIVYFGEWETAFSTTSRNYEVVDNDTMSNGQGRTINRTGTKMQLTFSVEEEGDYLVQMPYYNGNNKERSHIIAVDGADEAETPVPADGRGTYSKTLHLTAGEHTISIECVYSLTAIFDYLLVSKTQSDVTVSITGAKGLATFTPSVALDFTNAQSIEAYTATVSGTTVNLTRTNTVAAGEGVLIRSLNGGSVSEDIPVATAAVKPTADNMFVGVLEEIAQLPTNKGGYTNFILNNNGANGSGFYLANNKTVAAGKAYLRVPAESAGKLTFFSLDGSVTGIEGVQAEAAEGEKVYYNLNGQRVATPSKGLYILNGKKVIVK